MKTYIATVIGLFALVNVVVYATTVQKNPTDSLVSSYESVAVVEPEQQAGEFGVVVSQPAPSFRVIEPSVPTPVQVAQPTLVVDTEETVTYVPREYDEDEDDDDRREEREDDDD